MFRKLWKNKKALSSAVAVGMALSLIVVAYVFPIALLEIADANTTGWNAAVISIFQIVLPIVAVVGLAMKFLPSAKK